jgi:hypothetical protein
VFDACASNMIRTLPGGLDASVAPGASDTEAGEGG